jgi:hypothetical protein
MVPGSDDFNSGLVYGPNYSFYLTAPSGWVLDDKSGVSNGFQAVFYPSNFNWKNSPVVMYANWTYKDSVIKDIKSFVENDLERARENGNKNVTAIKTDTIITNKGQVGEIWSYNGDQWQNSEQICYFEEKNGIVILVLSSRTKNEFDKSIAAFKILLRSYSFLGIKVKTKK